MPLCADTAYPIEDVRKPCRSGCRSSPLWNATRIKSHVSIFGPMPHSPCRASNAIRLPANQTLQNRIGYLLKRPVGRPPNEVRHHAFNSTDGGTCAQMPKKTRQFAPRNAAAGPDRTRTAVYRDGTCRRRAKFATIRVKFRIHLGNPGLSIHRRLSEVIVKFLAASVNWFI